MRERGAHLLVVEVPFWADNAVRDARRSDRVLYSPQDPLLADEDRDLLLLVALVDVALNLSGDPLGFLGSFCETCTVGAGPASWSFFPGRTVMGSWCSLCSISEPATPRIIRELR